MSFPTKFSSSPSPQRDYAILGNRPFHATLDSDLVSEHSEDEGDGNDEEARAQIAQDSSISEHSVSDAGAGSETDNMSELSLPGQDRQQRRQQRAQARAAQSPEQRRQERSARRARRSSSRSEAFPAAGTSASGSVSYSRGSRSALPQGFTMTSTQNRRPSMARTEAFGGMSQFGGIPSSYLLGGQHMMPPADADMRSQSELDYLNTAVEDEDEDQEEIRTAPDAYEAGDDSQDYNDLRPEDNDITPRPGMHQAFLHSITPATQTQPHTKQRRTSSSSYAAGGVASERSPLLGSSSAHAPSGYGSSSVASIGGLHHSHVTHAHHAQTPIQGAASGWDIQQPAPPTLEQIDEIREEPRDKIVRREFAVLTKFAAQVWACHLLELSLNVVSVFSLGHLGTNELAAASLSSMTANVTGFSILNGFISALDSILPGAYTSQPKMVGLYTQRMLVVVCYLLVPVLTVWAFSEHVLLALGQDPIVASLASQYLRILAFGLPGYAGFEVCRRYLQAQGLMHAPTIVLLVVSPINAVLNYLLVWGPDKIRLGFIGAPVASVISMWLMCVFGVVQCIVAPRVAWDGWSRLAFSGLKPILQLGTAGTFAMCAEWWSWEIVGLVTSKLGTTALASQSVLLTCSSISYQLPYGLSVAAAVRVGNLLGANQPDQASLSSDVAMILSVLSGAFNSAFFLFTRNKLGALFSEDQAVIALVTNIVPLVGLFQVADGVCGVAGGLLRGTGRQSAGAIINLTGYYVIGIPIGLALTFSKLQWGLSGLWTGLTLALVYGSVFSYLIIRRIDWHDEVHRTMARMGADETTAKHVPHQYDGATTEHGSIRGAITSPIVPSSHA